MSRLQPNRASSVDVGALDCAQSAATPTGIAGQPAVAVSTAAARRRGGRRETILDAASALVATRGTDGFRLDEVAAAAGVSKATLFRWFGNRAQLVAALDSERGVAMPPDVPARREVIIEAASHLMATQGVRATTMEQVASAAGVSTPALYWHFANKEQLVTEVIRVTSPLPLVQAYFRDQVTGDLWVDLMGMMRLADTFAPRMMLIQRIASDVRGDVDRVRQVALDEVARPVWALLDAYFADQESRGNLVPAPAMPRVLAFVGMDLAVAFVRVTFGNAVINDFEHFAQTLVNNFLTGAATPAYRTKLAERTSDA
jgi:AcrR family transcriptional regulator